MDLYLAGKKVKLDPARSLGKGGEADVYDIGNAKALKVFKQPDHPDYAGQQFEQDAARERLDTHQQKLRAFPLNLPLRVITPEELAFDKSGQRILGYTMPLLTNAELLMKYGERAFRQGGISNDDVLNVFRDLHATVGGLHKQNVVIGDFNDLNVLVAGGKAYLIDADSFQFKNFYCRMFTTKFVDPVLCDPALASLMLNKPHNAHSDWYAYTIMLMQSLLFVGPYGGVYRPRDAKNMIPHDARPLKRVTVFDSEVRYPKPAIPFNVLPDELLHHFHQVFKEDIRGEFPLRLVDAMRWTKCTACGTEHARGTCPQCVATPPAALKEAIKIRGNVTSTRIFMTEGVILAAALNKGELHWLYHEGKQFKREDGTAVTGGALDPKLKYRLFGRATILAKDGRAVTLVPGKAPEQLSVDMYHNLPLLETTETHRYWIQNGQLMRDNALAPEYVGDVLAGQTLFWVGAKFGFGFYRAGSVNVAFVFDALKRGINDNVKLPPLRGHLLDAACTFSDSRCWFFAALKDGANTVNLAVVINADGKVEATAEGAPGDGTWLANIRGKCAAANFLFAATDDGLVRLEVGGSKIVKTREFPDTEPFVDAGCHLFAGRRGLYVVEPQRIQVLQIS